MVKTYYTKFFWGNGRENETETYNSVEDFINEWTNEKWKEWYLSVHNGEEQTFVKHSSNTAEKPYISKTKDFSDPRFSFEVRTNDTFGCRMIGLNRLDVDGVCWLNKIADKNNNYKYIITKPFIENVQKPIEELIHKETEIKYAEEEPKAELNPQTEELRKALKTALNESTKSLETIPFTRENYNKLFPYSRIDTPIENVKLGEHQFEKLDSKERQMILKAVYEALNNPDVVINEMRKTVFDDEKPAHIYAKSFEIDGKNKAIQSVVVDIENENVSISTHERDINNVINKIKKPEQLIYTSEEIGLKIERITGKQLVTVNQTRVNDKIESPKTNIPQTNEKSTTNEPTSIEVDGIKRELPNGLASGFIKAVQQNDKLTKDYNTLVKEYNEVVNENDKLRQQLQNKNHNKGNGYN